jgi:hypothetical protein
MIDTLKIAEDLSKVMDPAAAYKVASVLGTFYEDMHNMLTKDRYQGSQPATQKPAEAQKPIEDAPGREPTARTD